MAIYHYDTEKILRSVPKLSRFCEGDVAVIEKDHRIFTYHNDQWITQSSGELKISLMELNESIMSQYPDIDDLTEFKKELNRYEEKYNTLILLQHDYHYITVFQRNDEFLEPFVDVFEDCIHYIGKLKGYDFYEDGHAEIWINTIDGVKMFILMPYDGGMVYYHG